ncbi:hypothetical protein UA08_06844 [Talaromyces atroroseus]|uniref:Uncharacterized protein n=1 Tax=Talaromyces atroroseus TaxID=1441469 RepID=A0A225ACC7_TALAT|nr:hypothetical protein UA08_06844 [Talaromyces atroroseus]OKL58020.1 hypothetical protein UA08_06844 [Talaromyces atroroseus]
MKAARITSWDSLPEYMSVPALGPAPLVAPFFAERVNIKWSQLVKLEPVTDSTTVAAMGDPFGSSWMALQCRAIVGCRGRTVAIFGATSAGGKAVVSSARFLGVGIARDADTLPNIEGLDDGVVLTKISLCLPALALCISC